MTLWLIAALGGIALALMQYGRALRGGSLAAGAAMLLRALVVTIAVALLLDAPVGAAHPLRPVVALDGSASWTRAADAALWRQALARAREATPDSLLIFGDSLRTAPRGAELRPRDPASRVRPAVERAVASGRPLIVVTDGELDDADALTDLPAGSRVDVLAHPSRRDAALVSLEIPRALVAGDTVLARVGVRGGNGGAAAGTLSIALGERRLASAPVSALPAYGTAAIDLRFVPVGGDGPAIARATIASPGDVEPHNDTLAVGVDLSRAPGAVFVSTAPDFDSRYALDALRDALAVPTRGFLRVAPGAWRVAGTLAPVAESEVRAALRDAPLAVLHGDTAALGDPRRLSAGALLLFAPPSGETAEYFATAAPPSPLAGALAGAPWDSLPPLQVSPRMPAFPSGGWIGLQTRRARTGDERPAIVGSEAPRHLAIVGASGLWRWRFRGGASADVYAALWGSLFDWLLEGRRDRRAALPEAGVLREGEPVRWRRGAGSDSVVRVVLAPVSPSSGSGRVDTLLLRFPPAATVIESPPLRAGVYEARVAGGTSLLVVNRSAEWLPRAPTRSQSVGGQVASIGGRGARSAGWLFLLGVLLVCAEWLVRRRIGLR